MSASLLASLTQGATVRYGSVGIEKIKDLENEKLEHVVQFMTKRVGSTLEYAKSAHKEFLQYFFLLILEKKKLLCPPAADDFWHAFLLFNREYEAFCMKYHGSMIYHIPGDEDEPEDIRTSRRKLITDLFAEVWGGKLLGRPNCHSQGDGGDDHFF